jgi:uncharacterized membrane protein YfcA
MRVGPLHLILLALTGVAAGGLGAMLGIGGGLLVIPVLVLGFGAPAHAAVATSLVAVVATSTATASVYVGRGLTNLRLAMTLELATTAGAIGGGVAAALLSERVLLGLFAGFSLLTAGLLLSRRGADEAAEVRATPGPPRGAEARGRLGGVYQDEADGRLVEYRARRLPLGMAASAVAGAVSGLLGVGGRFLKVPAMALGMGVPIKVAAATSNFMIGVTAAASLAVYAQRGFLQPLLAAPVALGVAAGSLAGTAVAARAPAAVLARLLAAALAVAAVQMGLRAAGVWGA